VFPHIRWCLTGPFAFLPIHAAGLYGTDNDENIVEYAVSSYTPTISALLTATPSTPETFKMMAVAQPYTPGQKPLAYTRDEIRRIRRHVPQECLVAFEGALIEDVSAHLATSSIVHFACHGEQNDKNPLESALLLKDGRLQVTQIMARQIPTGSLAFLSACQTATGDKYLPDEAIHLAACLLFAGFRGVVATMWPIHDSDGPEVADAFYEHLFETSHSNTVDSNSPHPYVDTTKAAVALQLAVAKLRAKGVPFKRWAPFVHYGI